MKSVLLYGYYGRFNFGDDCMVRSFVPFIRKQYGVNVEILAKDHYLASQLASENVALIPRDLSATMKHLVRTDALIGAGGTFYHDSYTGKKRQRYIINLIALTGFFALARLLGKKVLFVGIGLGPAQTRIVRFLIRCILNLSSGTLVRDSRSVQTARESGYKGAIHSASDLVLLNDAFLNLVDPNDKAKILGISALSLAPFIGEEESSRFWNLLTEAVINRLESDPTIQIRLFSFFCGRGGLVDGLDDDTICGRIAERLREKLKNPVSIISFDGQVDPFQQQLSECRWFIAARYHAAVVSTFSNSLVLPIFYNRKVRDFADEMGMPADQGIKIDRFDQETMESQINRLFLSDEFHSSVNIGEQRRKLESQIRNIFHEFVPTPR
jgi:polysaccharide pyruvyl transferase WcaK-like protein